MKVLFLCKHNKFRSRVAEAYFNKLNKKKKIKNRAKSAGFAIIPGRLDKWEIIYCLKLGFDIRGKQKKLNQKLLNWQDLIIIVADDVRRSQIKNYKKYKIVVWKIKDTEVTDKEGIKKIIKEIIKRIDDFVIKSNKEDYFF